MTSSDISLISLSNIKNISIQTSQKISSKYITKFIQTSLQLNDIILIENDKVFFSYIKESSIYEIYILNSKSPNISIESKIFENNTKSKNYDYEIYILNKYYIVYKNSKCYFFKENKNYAKNDIINYIEFKYKIKILNCNIVSHDTHDGIKNDYLDKNYIQSINFINIQKNKFLLYYFAYLFTFMIFIYFSLSISSNKNYKNTHNQTLQNKIIINNKDTIKVLIKNLNNYNIKVNQIIFNNYSYDISLYSTSVKKIYKFLSLYGNKLTIKNVNESKKKYYLEITIAL